MQTERDGSTRVGEGLRGTRDECQYLTVMIDGTKHFFALNPVVAQTTDFTRHRPGAAERRCLAFEASPSYGAHWVRRQKPPRPPWRWRPPPDEDDAWADEDDDGD